MTPKGYTTEEKIENYLLQDIDSSFSDQIDNWIVAVENYIDKETGRNFIADSTASERRFNGSDKNIILIDDCIEVTKVEVATDVYGESLTEISSDDYILLPRDYDADGKPIKGVFAKNYVFSSGIKGLANHQITAKWGYSESVPGDIEFAATVLVGGIINFQRGSGQEVKSEKIGDYSISYNNDNSGNSMNDFQQIEHILKSYKKYNL